MVKNRFRSLFLIIILFICFCLVTIDYIRFSKLESIPNHVSYTEIEDENIDGKLKFYYDDKSNLYWLLHIDDIGEKKLVMRTGDVSGYVKIKIIDTNKIQIHFDYFDNLDYPIKDKKITIDLSKNETYNISLLRRLLQ